MISLRTDHFGGRTIEIHHDLVIIKNYPYLSANETSLDHGFRLGVAHHKRLGIEEGGALSLSNQFEDRRRRSKQEGGTQGAKGWNQLHEPHCYSPRNDLQ